MMRQLMSILTSFLMNRASTTLLCLRAIMNFVRLAMYNSHTETTLNYMQTTLHNIDRLKMIFKDSRSLCKRSKCKETKRKHFNFSKFHVMIHYVDSIKEFENVVEVDSSYDENAHKFTIKDFYARINKHLNFNEQILMHNIRRQNFLAMNDVLLYVRTKSKINVDNENVVKINIIFRDSIRLHD